MEVKDGEQVIELHPRTPKVFRLIFHAILRQSLVHVQREELLHVVLQDGLPLVARRMLVVFRVPVQDLVDRLLRGHLQSNVIEKDVLNADELGAFAEIADHKLRIDPPRIIVHVEVGSWKGWRDVCKSTLPIIPRIRSLQLEEQNLNIDLLLIHVERPRLKPVTDVFACIHDDGLAKQGRIGSK